MGEQVQDDVWADADRPGTRSSWRLSGADGLDRLSGPTTVTAAPAGGFAARLTRLRLDRVAVETFTSTPHTSARLGPELLAHDAARLSFLLLVEGEARVELSGSGSSLGPGDALAIDSRDEVVWSTSTDSRIVRVAVGAEHLPGPLRRPGAVPSGSLQRTALTDGYAAFVRALLGSSATEREGVSADRLDAAMTGLHSAVLQEGRQLRLLRAGGLRDRMEHLIESRLADPGLGPVTIARELGLSLRQAHAVFDDGERTLARAIRERRLDAVALEVRTAAELPRLPDLARRHGFGSPDTLARAFRRRFGTSMREHRAGGGPG